MTTSRFIVPGEDFVPQPAAVVAAPRSLGELLRYFIASAAALTGDTGIYWAAFKLGFGYGVSAALGFAVGLTVAYVFSIRWAFRQRRLDDRATEFMLFAGVGAIGLVLTEGLLWLTVGQLGWPPLMSKLLTAGIVFFFNFGVRKALLFTRGDARGT